jgi:hypothetical protein
MFAFSRWFHMFNYGQPRQVMLYLNPAGTPGCLVCLRAVRLDLFKD